jgi:hypothetical protein
LGDNNDDDADSHETTTTIPDASSVKHSVAPSQDQQGNLTLEDNNDDDDDADSHETTTSVPDASSVTRSLSYDEEESACVICLEPFRVGDCVTWSRNSRALNCLHIFHSDCILPWLEEKRHDDCPSCRSTLILPSSPIPNHDDDENNNHNSEGDFEHKDEENHDFPSDDEEQHEEDWNASSSNVFVIMQGLVSSAARRANYTLVGQDLEIETTDIVPEPPFPLSIPSPLRRVMSHGSHLLPHRPSLGGLFRRRLSFSKSTDEHVEKNEDASFPNTHMEVLQRPFSLRRTASEGLGIHTRARPSFATTLPLPPLPPPSSGVRRRGVSSGRTSNMHHNRATDSTCSEHSQEDELGWLDTSRSSWQTSGSLSELDDILDIPEGSADVELGKRMLTPNRSTL